MTDDELKAIEARVDAATAASVNTGDPNLEPSDIVSAMRQKAHMDGIRATFDLLNHARTDIPALVSEVRRLRGAIAAQENRDYAAGARVGIRLGCDTSDEMADEIVHLTGSIADASRALTTARARVATLESRLAELAVCRCDEAWTTRGLHAPECHADEGLLD